MISAAKLYQKNLESVFGTNGIPCFDLVLLGMVRNIYAVFAELYQLLVLLFLSFFTNSFYPRDLMGTLHRCSLATPFFRKLSFGWLQSPIHRNHHRIGLLWPCPWSTTPSKSYSWQQARASKRCLRRFAVIFYVGRNQTKSTNRRFWNSIDWNLQICPQLWSIPETQMAQCIGSSTKLQLLDSNRDLKWFVIILLFRKPQKI